MPDLSFEQAIAESSRVLSELESGNMEEEQARDQIALIVSTQAGARGFFVALLTGELKLSDSPSQSIVEALTRAPEITGDLLAKNLVMSACTAVSHERRGDERQAQGSRQVTRRTANLIKLLRLNDVERKLADMSTAVHDALNGGTTSGATYSDFLKRWNYDKEQLRAAEQALTSLPSNPT